METRQFTVPFRCSKKVLMNKAGSCESKYNKIPAGIYVRSTTQNIELTLLTYLLLAVHTFRPCKNHGIGLYQLVPELLGCTVFQYLSRGFLGQTPDPGFFGIIFCGVFELYLTFRSWNVLNYHLLYQDGRN